MGLWLLSLSHPRVLLRWGGREDSQEGLLSHLVCCEDRPIGLRLLHGIVVLKVLYALYVCTCMYVHAQHTCTYKTLS